MDRIEALEDALTITWAEADHIRISDARRLTGPGMIWDHPGAVIDVFVEDDTDAVVAAWGFHARRVLDALGWWGEHVTTRRFQGGLNLALSAPMDQLYSAIFAAQTAWHFCAADLLDTTPHPFKEMIEDIKEVMKQESDPALITLIRAAADHDVDILSDDDAVSIGHGCGSQTWPIGGLPSPADVDWTTLHDIPVALITGTNGKTTTTRLCTAIAQAAGKMAGLTSTDMVRVGDDILDRGDYSGPGGARMLLRDARVEIVCLEVARGGILRRGLPTKRARVAVVTNVAKDHLGEYGVNTVPELAQAKFAVHRTLPADGMLVLNADDPASVAEAPQVDKTICWFSLDPNAPQIVQAQANGTPCAYQNGTDLIYFDGHAGIPIMGVADAPVTLFGAAKYNIRNVLAAICASVALEIPCQAIKAGISGFKPDAQDNPGRCNEFSYNGARVFIDFAHNVHSISAISETLGALPALRRFLMQSHPGDRSDADIRAGTTAALAFKPDVVIAADLPDHLRGRTLGEVPDLITSAAMAGGVARAQIDQTATPSIGARLILNQLRPGDVALLLVLSDRDKVFEMLQAAQAG
tara:strand:- start:285 stop:2030 length:1746 start_codon:yes stop_codon:yes gene_type:complete